MDQNAKQQVIDRLREANNVLVTVSTNPSVDQLAACIGLTLLLNKLGKHGTAVFSGTIPSTLEFLKPEETIEKNTDSLRDFIIALDKIKADKLRYKVEDKVVKIFITPYRTSLSEGDLDFSQGDFNVDVVIGLGVHERSDLDKAIVAHGRILHDATLVSVNNHDQGTLGAINWVDLNASSLSEMLVSLSKGLTNEPLDSQMATAFMTGIVAETARFSNDKTSAETMTFASELMSAGANQQLIASELEAVQPTSPTSKKADEPAATDVDIDEDGSLRISHDDDPAEPAATLPPVEGADESTSDEPEAVPPPVTPPSPPSPEPPQEEPEVPPAPKISKMRNEGLLVSPPDHKPNTATTPINDSNRVTQPPAFGAKLTANSEPEHMQVESSTDALSGGVTPSHDDKPPVLSHSSLSSGDGASVEPAEAPTTQEPTLQKIEEMVKSPHVAQDSDNAAPSVGVSNDQKGAVTTATENLEDARDAVNEAISAASDQQPLDPIAALGAQPVNLNLHDSEEQAPNDVSGSVNPQPSAEAATTLPPASQEPPVPYFPPTDPVTAPTATEAPGLAPPANLPGSPVGSGINPNIPPQLIPTSPIADTAAGSAAPPPPVPPPMMPTSSV